MRFDHSAASKQIGQTSWMLVWPAVALTRCGSPDADNDEIPNNCALDTLLVSGACGGCDLSRFDFISLKQSGKKTEANGEDKNEVNEFSDSSS